LELASGRRKPKKQLPKARLIRSYAKNLSDADILQNIQNFEISENELVLVIPKKFRYLRTEYEKAIKDNIG